MAARVRADDRLGVALALTRKRPRGWGDPPGRVDAAHNFGPFAQYARRVDAEMLADVSAGLGGPGAVQSAYVCGPTPFVEAVSVALVQIGLPAGAVRTERFGPSGVLPSLLPVP